jgi:hypothetical protein
MFDFDLSKMILVGVVALVVVGPKELPAVLRTLARTIAKLRRVQLVLLWPTPVLIRSTVNWKGLGKTMRVNIALNPATAMRGSLPTSESIAARLEAGGAAICFARNAGLSGAAHRRAEGFIHALTARRRPMANPPPFDLSNFACDIGLGPAARQR